MQLRKRQRVSYVGMDDTITTNPDKQFIVDLYIQKNEHLMADAETTKFMLEHPLHFLNNGDFVRVPKIMLERNKLLTRQQLDVLFYYNDVQASPNAASTTYDNHDDFLEPEEEDEETSSSRGKNRRRSSSSSRIRQQHKQYLSKVTASRNFAIVITSRSKEAFACKVYVDGEKVTDQPYIGVNGGSTTVLFGFQRKDKLIRFRFAKPELANSSEEAADGDELGDVGKIRVEFHSIKCLGSGRQDSDEEGEEEEEEEVRPAVETTPVTNRAARGQTGANISSSGATSTPVKKVQRGKKLKLKVAQTKKHGLATMLPGEVLNKRNVKMQEKQEPDEPASSSAAASSSSATTTTTVVDDDDSRVDVRTIQRKRKRGSVKYFDASENEQTITLVYKDVLGCMHELKTWGMVPQTAPIPVRPRSAASASSEPPVIIDLDAEEQIAQQAAQSIPIVEIEDDENETATSSLSLATEVAIKQETRQYLNEEKLKAVEGWNVDTVKGFITAIAHQHASKFETAKVNGKTLVSLSRQKLATIGISDFRQQHQLLTSIQQYLLAQ